jgi:SNF2 family DNA or RNA helicase
MVSHWNTFTKQTRWYFIPLTIDLFSLIKFLRIEPLDKRSEWSSSITKPINMSKSPRAFGKLQILMKGITLRRVKTDIVDGKPILVLPPKVDEIRYLVMNEKERQLYDKVHKAGKAMFESLKASGTVMKNYVNILRAILMMRQACLHPSLVKYQEAHSVVEEDDIVDLGAPMSVDRAESVFKVLSQTDQDICIFCTNTVEITGAMITPCSHLYDMLNLRVCETCVQSLFSAPPLAAGPSSSSAMNQKPSVPCPSCNIPVNRKNLMEIPESAAAEKGQADLNFDMDEAGMTYPTKLEALILDLEQVRAKDSTSGVRTPTKSVVFSQFTAMLNLCEVC